jgi:hypothetical protein
VPFLLVPFLWARKEKTLAYRRKKMLNQITAPSKEIPISIITDSASLTLRDPPVVASKEKQLAEWRKRTVL